MYSVNLHQPIVNTYNQQQSPCKHHEHCTVIPPYMQERIGASIDDPIAKEQFNEILARQKRLRSKRAKLFSGKKKARAVAAQNNEIIKIYDAQSRTNLPGVFVENAMNSQDNEVKEAYNWSLKTHEFFQEYFDRNSIDNKGMEMISTVHFDKNYSNAFWDGRQMVYGDGDGQIFNEFTGDSDITAHEITHGITQFDNDLDYISQSGALNESISDVFGSMVKQYVQGESVETADWLIGEQLVIGDNYALRSMKSPGTAYVDHPVLGTDIQPATMDEYDYSSRDNYGVHINSGIPNHAFYIFANRLYEIDNEKYHFSWSGAGKVWYLAKNRIHNKATFLDFANATIIASEEIFGKDSAEAAAVRYSWADVKVLGSTETDESDKTKDSCCTIC